MKNSKDKVNQILVETYRILEINFQQRISLNLDINKKKSQNKMIFKYIL